MTELRETALAWAKAGHRVFPCLPGTKVPATPNGFKDASADPAVVTHWWTDNPNYNVAMCPDHNGWAVIDPEAEAGENWSEGRPVPETYTVRTPRGGRHLYFEGSCPSSIRKLFKGQPIDTRGVGGYVLIPPSIVDGKPYTVEKEIDLAPLPAWVNERLATTSKKVEVTRIVTEDQPQNVFRAIDYLKSLPEYMEGEGSDDGAFKAACVLKDFGISPERATELMMDHFRCNVKDREWVATKVANVFNHGQNDPGAHAIAPAVETFASYTEKHADAPPERSRYYFEDDNEMDHAPEQVALLPELLFENSIALIVARKGSFKTFLAMDMALAIATGKETMGIQPTSIGPTFYGGHEGLHLIKRLHRKAWKLARGVEGQTGFYAAPGPTISSPQGCVEFLEQIRTRSAGRRPRLIVLDTYSMCMAGMSENDPKDVTTFIEFCKMLIREFPGVCVLVLAHFGKDESKGTRGSNALEAGVDTVIDVNREGNSRMVTLKVRNHRGAAERELPWTMEGKVVGKSLVFEPVSASEVQAKKRDEAPVNREKVHTALKALRAYGEEKSVTSDVLAQEIIGTDDGLSVEEREPHIRKMASALRSLSARVLAGYCVRHPKTGNIIWFLPKLEA